jgi:hypothetical protein
MDYKTRLAVALQIRSAFDARMVAARTDEPIRNMHAALEDDLRTLSWQLAVLPSNVRRELEASIIESLQQLVFCALVVATEVKIERNTDRQAIQHGGALPQLASRLIQDELAP